MNNELNESFNEKPIVAVENKYGNRIAIMNFLKFPGWLATIAIAVAQYAAEEALKKYTESKAVDVSHATLKEIENLLRYFVEESIRLEWEGVVSSSIEKFTFYNSTKELYWLESILTRNVEALSVLRNAGPSAVIAWMAAAQNVISALLIQYGEKNQAMKDAAARYIPLAIDFLNEAHEYNKNRVSDCENRCKQGSDTKWKCCYIFDGDEHCTKRQSKHDARKRCNQDADSTRNRVIQEFELAIYYPALTVIEEWKKIRDN
ncbi:hypothetical protein CN444_15840 [Bacillus thuringiensis]|uniref:hypothetical protein n=1 Tax=Bacillus thuringiensis TaxID=1428 RepID=UPI000BF72CFF|nr:hypothetical protein [Bacillus thuringiensis]PEW46571.1 hypothetical protein CN444_15840 [Bacillus thuringiensis]